MAEYVRRKRPPASHPYWARLYDRAHPPRGVVPVVVPAVFGLLFGLYAGLRPNYTLKEAFGDALAIASLFAGFAFVLSSPILYIDAMRYASPRRRWVAVLFYGAAIAIGVFIAAAILLLILFVVYSLCAGMGPWVGMAIGTLIAAFPARWSPGPRAGIGASGNGIGRNGNSVDRGPGVRAAAAAIALAPVGPTATEPESPQGEQGLSAG